MVKELEKEASLRKEIDNHKSQGGDSESFSCSQGDERNLSAPRPHLFRSVREAIEYDAALHSRVEKAKLHHDKMKDFKSAEADEAGCTIIRRPITMNQRKEEKKSRELRYSKKKSKRQNCGGFTEKANEMKDDHQLHTALNTSPTNQGSTDGDLWNSTSSVMWSYPIVHNLGALEPHTPQLSKVDEDVMSWIEGALTRNTDLS